MEPYIPTQLPLVGLDYHRLLKYVGTANSELARYDGLLQGIINPALLLSPLVTQEAVLSSKIEGTQVTIEDVLEQEAGLLQTGKKYDEVQEVLNYRTTLLVGQEYLANRPLNLGCIRQLHQILMKDVRGGDKHPGEFRKVQNWIGSEKSDLSTAVFVPPSPLRLLDDLQALENYIASEDIDAILQTAIVHAQFELIHPFNDGNGRIGRILIPLFLYKKNVLSQPMFYLSSYLEANRTEYYARLRGISEKEDWTAWLEFFLQAVTIQAKENNDKVKKVLSLYEEMKKRIYDLTRTTFTIQTLDAIFDRPIFQTSEFISKTGIHKATAMGILLKLKENGVLKELRPGRGRQSQILGFEQLIEIVEG